MSNKTELSHEDIERGMKALAEKLGLDELDYSHRKHHSSGGYWAVWTNGKVETFYKFSEIAKFLANIPTPEQARLARIQKLKDELAKLEGGEA